MSDKTPRTDKWLKDTYGGEDLALFRADKLSLINFARQLERELTAARAEVGRLEKELALAKSSQSLTSLR